MPKAKPRFEYVYGMNPAFEVLRAGRREVKSVMLNEGAKDNKRLVKLADFAERKEYLVEWVPKGRLFDFAQTREHQGVVLKTGHYPYADFEPLLETRRLLLLDNVEDPHNTGAIIRSADCFGFDGVLLPHRGSPEVYPSVVKVSAGACEHLSIVRNQSAIGYFRACREAGFKAVALDAAGTANLRELGPELEQEKVLLVIGGEAKAVGQFILNETDYTARIDQFGKINSLNASVAAGIAMYAVR
jgi:23S rRNA (guanosine2251-2'-O)-methyltransferase